ncbi:hypothetical protein [Pseudomonas sp. SDO55104_S430]
MNDDLILVPRGLLGSASHAIDKKLDAPETLKLLRRYTCGDLFHPLSDAPVAPQDFQPIYQFSGISAPSWSDISKECYDEYTARGRENGWQTRIVYNHPYASELVAHCHLQRAKLAEAKTDRLHKDLIAAQATIANQAKMIEHLRGGLTGYTAVDMTTAAAQGFRDGVASKAEPCDGCFMAEAEALRKDAERYRWLRNSSDNFDCSQAESMEEIDAMIDSAMSKEG